MLKPSVANISRKNGTEYTPVKIGFYHDVQTRISSESSIRLLSMFTYSCLFMNNTLRNDFVVDIDRGPKYFLNRFQYH